MSDSEIVEIALAADDGYFCGLFVTACSIAQYADKAVFLSFNILDGGIKDDNFVHLESTVVKIHPESSFRRLLVTDSMFEGYPNWHGNKMAYARLILPQALPMCDWVVYCDVDFLWMRDISELWRQRQGDVALIGTKDGVPYTVKSEAIWFKEKGYPFDPECYFCSGLSFMNLRMFRSRGFIKQCESFLLKHPDVHYPDQNALNIVTYGLTKIVPSMEWQCFTQDLRQEYLNAGTVLHYAGEVPWKKMSLKRGYQLLSDTMLLWHRYNARLQGVTLWYSLRSYFSVSWILFHRLPVYLFRMKIFAGLSCVIANMMNHRGVVDVLLMRSRKLQEPCAPGKLR